MLSSINGSELAVGFTSSTGYVYASITYKKYDNPSVPVILSTAVNLSNPMSSLSTFVVNPVLELTDGDYNVNQVLIFIAKKYSLHTGDTEASVYTSIYNGLPPVRLTCDDCKREAKDCICFC